MDWLTGWFSSEECAPVLGSAAWIRKQLVLKELLQPRVQSPNYDLQTCVITSQKLLDESLAVHGHLRRESMVRLFDYLMLRPRFVWDHPKFSKTVFNKLIEFRDGWLALPDAMRTLFPSAPELHLCTEFKPMYVGR